MLCADPPLFRRESASNSWLRNARAKIAGKACSTTNEPFHACLSLLPAVLSRRSSTPNWALDIHDQLRSKYKDGAGRPP